MSVAIELERLGYVNRQDYQPKQPIFSTGDRADRLVVLTDGVAKLCYETGTTWMIVGAESVLGDQDVLKGWQDVLKESRLHTTSATAVGPCQVYILEKKEIPQLIGRSTDFALALLEAQSEFGALVRERDRELQNPTYSIKERLAFALIAIERAFKSPLLKGLIRKDYADFIGRDRRPTSVAFSEFEDAGIITKQRKQIQILDQEKLKQIAHY